MFGAKWMFSGGTGGGTLARYNTAAAESSHEIPAVTDGRLEVTIANAQNMQVMGVTGAEPGQRILTKDLGRAPPAVRIHVIGHQFQTVQLGPLFAQDLIKRLSPPERMSGNDSTSLAADFPTEVCHLNPLGKGERIGRPVNQKMPLRRGDFDPGQNH